MLIVGILIGALLLRLAWLQLAQGAYFRRLSEENRIDREVLRAERGRIFDRNGEVLADNFPMYRVTLDLRDPMLKKNLPRVAEVVQALAPILGRDETELAAEVERARKRSSRPIPISRSLSFDQVAQLEERMERLPGVAVETEAVRRYPEGRFVCHLLGYLGEVSEDDLASDKEERYHPGDLVGRAGIEKQYEATLRGQDGVAFVEVDAYGRRTHYFPELKSIPAEPGSDLVLTIDARVQRAAEAALDGLPRRPARSPGAALAASVIDTTAPGTPAAIVAMDPETGEVLALASRPAFDPSAFLRGLTREEWRALDDASHPLLNRATQAAYPPGSTFKCLTTLAGLEEGIIAPGRGFSGCGGGYAYGNRVFRCWKSGGHGSLGLLDALARSCDVYYYQVGLQLGVDRIGRYAARAKIAEKTGIDLPQERGGLVPTTQWYEDRLGKGRAYKGAALNIAIGQGEVLLTPLELCRFTCAVANGGRILKPHVSLRVQGPDGTARRDAAEEDWDVGHLPASQANLRLLQEAMERVVMDNGGTGGRARVGAIRVGGKTGTAQNPHGDDHALFICYAPVEDPRIAVAVVVEESGHGGSVAAPVAQQVLQAYLAPDLGPEQGSTLSSMMAWEGD